MPAWLRTWSCGSGWAGAALGSLLRQTATQSPQGRVTVEDVDVDDLADDEPTAEADRLVAPPSAAVHARGVLRCALCAVFAVLVHVAGRS